MDMKMTGNLRQGGACWKDVSCRFELEPPTIPVRAAISPWVRCRGQGARAGCLAGA